MSERWVIVRWCVGVVAVAMVLELVARWALPDYADDPAGMLIAGLMMFWLGAGVGVGLERRNQRRGVDR